MVANEDEMARNIALARELYYSGKLGAMGPSKKAPPPKKSRRRSSTGSMATPTAHMPFSQWSMDILREECNVQIVVPPRRRSDSTSRGCRIDQRRSRTDRPSRHSLGRTILEIPSTEKSVDSLLLEINPFGRFHQMILLLLFCGAAPIVGFQNFVLESQSVIPKWSCITETCHSLTRTYTYSAYNPNTTHILCSLDRSTWKWDNILLNAVSQWDIACSTGKVILETVFYVPGGVLGAFFVSRICDKMGRKLSFLVSLISCLTVGTMISSSQFFEAYVTFRLLLGTSLTALHLVNYIWTMEHFTHKTRPIANAAYDFIRLCCVPLLALLNSYVKSWNYLHLASTITLLAGVLVFFAVPESPRWLLLKGNVDGAENALKLVARRNHEQYPIRVVLKYNPHDKTSLRSKTKCRRLKYGVVIALWSTVHLAYFCIKSNILHFADDVNICEAVYSVSGLPLILLAGLFLCNRIGRRWTFLTLVTLTIISCILTLLPLHLPPTIIPAVTTHGICPALLSVLALWVVELLPTCHRVCVFSVLLAANCTLTTLASFLIPHLDARYRYTSMVLAVFLLFVSGALPVLLPDTKGVEMLEIPEIDEKSTRGMTFIENRLVSMNFPVIKTTNVDEVKPEDGADWIPPSPILF